MKVVFEQKDEKFKQLIEGFKQDLASFRVGRGSLQMIEALKAEVYGQTMPLNQIGTVSMVDASLIIVSPWDKNNISAIMKAVQTANLGINPLQDNDNVKLPIPPLTEERRKEYVKMMHEKHEAVRVQIRQIRKDIMSDLDNRKATSMISEDDFARMQKGLQKSVDETNKAVEDYSKEKESDMMQV